jgi:hypothetical protein
MFYANAKSDNTVHYCSAAVARFNQYKIRVPPPPNPEAPYIVDEVRIDQATEDLSERTPHSRLLGATQVVGTVLLSPLLLVQSLFFLPMRVVSHFKDPGHANQDDRARVVPQEQEQQQQPEQQQQQPQQSEKQREQEQLELRELQLQLEQQQQHPEQEQEQEQQQQQEEPDQDEDDSLDRLPHLIRFNLTKLPILRVVCMYPEPHTHGVIIHRRFWNKNGVQTLNHLATHFKKHGPFPISSSSSL